MCSKCIVVNLKWFYQHEESDYKPLLCFLLGGRNGYGAKLCNIFSTKFTVETSCKEYGKQFKQSWADNMGKAGEPKILPAKGDDYTCITFQVIFRVQRCCDVLDVRPMTIFIFRNL